MTTNKYTWKIGMELSSNTQLETNKPLTEDKVLIDLYDGKRFVVNAIAPARKGEKDWAFMSDTVLHTSPIKQLADEELAQWRIRAGYEPNSFCQPLGDIVFE
jgi:hypothetical protein